MRPATWTDEIIDSFKSAASLHDDQAILNALMACFADDMHLTPMASLANHYLPLQYRLLVIKVVIEFSKNHWNNRENQKEDE